MLRITRAVFPGRWIRFVGDAGLDDQKIIAWAVVAEEYDQEDQAVRTLVVLTNVPVTDVGYHQGGSGPGKIPPAEPSGY